MVYLYFTAMDKSEIRHMLYILPLDLLPNTHSQIENYIKCNCVCSVCIREIILVLFFYRICKLIYSLEDNKLCFVIPFTVYQSDILVPCVESQRKDLPVESTEID